MISPAHLAWPARLSALATGAVLARSVREATVPAESSALWPALGALLLLASVAALGRDHALSGRLGPRSRRPQWSARLALAAAAIEVAPWAPSRMLSALLAGASAGVLLRELREPGWGELLASLGAGAALGTASQLLAPPRVALAALLLALSGSALASLAATLRGGPGRPPARPSDVAALVVLAAAIGIGLSFR